LVGVAMRAAGLIAALVLLPALAAAQTSENLLLVVNTNSPQSVQIADHYIAVRHVPDRNVIRIKTAVDDTIGRAQYVDSIEVPIGAWLERHRLQDQVLYLVLTKGVPLRIDGTGGIDGTVASVDSELTLLYRRLVAAPISLVSRIENTNLAENQTEASRFTVAPSDLYLVTTLTRADSGLTLMGRKFIGAPVPITGRVDNPYFLGERPPTDAARFSRLTSDVYLVTRLDGFTVDDVIKLIDRGLNPAREGQIVLDQKASGVDRGGDAWLAQAAERLTSTAPTGIRVQLESTRAVATASGPVLGYFSWGSNDPANQRRDVGLQFANGAIGGTFVSTDGRTFREPNESWRPALAGSPTGGQSLVGDLIREGITGVSGHVAEPYLDAIVRPQILFPAYASGFNLAESFYLAMPYLSWQDIVIGDPLCAPFRRTPLAPADIHRGIDPDTDTPALFAERRLALLKASNLKIEALKLYLKAVSAELQGLPYDNARALLVQATAIEPRLTVAQLELAQDAEARGNADEAIKRYRSVVALEADNAVALNNLAYLLADSKKAIAEALPLAERAYRLSGEAPAVADTLGWVHYKAGDTAKALPYLERAAKLAPPNVDILIHVGTIHADLKNLEQARADVDALLKLDPKAAERADVKALIARIR
jgi:uncharacterized protein (TIGR03790 family)